MTTPNAPSKIQSGTSGVAVDSVQAAIEEMYPAKLTDQEIYLHYLFNEDFGKIIRKMKRAVQDVEARDKALEMIEGLQNGEGLNDPYAFVGIEQVINFGDISAERLSGDYFKDWFVIETQKIVNEYDASVSSLRASYKVGGELHQQVVDGMVILDETHSQIAELEKVQISHPNMRQAEKARRLEQGLINSGLVDPGQYGETDGVRPGTIQYTIQALAIANGDPMLNLTNPIQSLPEAHYPRILAAAKEKLLEKQEETRDNLPREFKEIEALRSGLPVTTWREFWWNVARNLAFEVLITAALVVVTGGVGVVARAGAAAGRLAVGIKAVRTGRKAAAAQLFRLSRAERIALMKTAGGASFVVLDSVSRETENQVDDFFLNAIGIMLGLGVIKSVSGLTIKGIAQRLSRSCCGRRST